jgi:type IV secretory pathway VirB4 component
MGLNIPIKSLIKGAKNGKGLPSTQEHIVVQDVRDAVVVLRTGDLAALLEVDGIDFARLPDGARTGLIAQFENFLDTLRFPYQFTIARRRQPLEEYLARLDQKAAQHVNAGNKPYAAHLYDWASFMLDVVQHVNPQIPHYLITLPYDPIPPEERARRKYTLTGERFQRGLDELQHRSAQVARALSRVGLSCRRLGHEEMIAVLHRVYHPSILDYRIPPIQRVKSFIAEQQIAL